MLIKSINKNIDDKPHKFLTSNATPHAPDRQRRIFLWGIERVPGRRHVIWRYFYLGSHFGSASLRVRDGPQSPRPAMREAFLVPRHRREPG